MIVKDVYKKKINQKYESKWQRGKVYKNGPVNNNTVGYTGFASFDVSSPTSMTPRFNNFCIRDHWFVSSSSSPSSLAIFNNICLVCVEAVQIQKFRSALNLSTLGGTSFNHSYLNCILVSTKLDHSFYKKTCVLRRFSSIYNSQ